MTLRPIESFEQFETLLEGAAVSRAVLTALQFDLFSRIHEQRYTVGALALKCEVSERGLGILLRALASLGLLIKEGETYRNIPFAVRYLSKHSPDHKWAYLSLFENDWEEWARLPEVIRTGKPISEESDRKTFTWAMHQRSGEFADAIASRVDLSGVRRLLDLGGGAGTYAISFLKRHPGLKATVFDRPAAIEVAETLAEAKPYRNRIGYIGGDFITDSLPSDCDAVFLSNVIHIYSPNALQSLLQKICDLLPGGGRIILLDLFLRDAEGILPQEAALFALTMLMFTWGGNSYQIDEVAGWLVKSGFWKIKKSEIGAETIIEAIKPEQKS